MVYNRCSLWKRSLSLSLFGQNEPVTFAAWQTFNPTQPCTIFMKLPDVQWFLICNMAHAACGIFSGRPRSLKALMRLSARTRIALVTHDSPPLDGSRFGGCWFAGKSMCCLEIARACFCWAASLFIFKPYFLGSHQQSTNISAARAYKAALIHLDGASFCTAARPSGDYER